MMSAYLACVICYNLTCNALIPEKCTRNVQFRKKIISNLLIWELPIGVLLVIYCFIDDSYNIEYSNRM